MIGGREIRGGIGVILSQFDVGTDTRVIDLVFCCISAFGHVLRGCSVLFDLVTSNHGLSLCNSRGSVGSRDLIVPHLRKRAIRSEQFGVVSTFNHGTLL